jgi:hypothetical protein
MAAAAFRVLNSASVMRFRPLHLPIRQLGRMVNFNRAVEVDCRPLAVASILNGVMASRAADGTSP